MAATGPARNDRRQTDYGFVSWRIDQGTSGNDGGFFQYTGTPCSGGSCPGWVEIDDNPTTRGTFAAGATALDQMHNDGSVWQFIGPACSGTCPGWLEIDDNKPHRMDCRRERAVPAAHRPFDLAVGGDTLQWDVLPRLVRN